MKHRLFFRHFLLLAVAAIAASCTKDEEDPGNKKAPVFVLSHESESKASQVFNAGMDWMIERDEDWFTVTPLFGGAEDTDITVTASGSNETYAERTGSFSLVSTDGKSKIVCPVIQKGLTGLRVDNRRYSVSTGTTEFILPVYANADFEVESNAGWLAVGNIEKESEGELIGDTGVRSEYIRSNVHFSLSNEGADTERIAAITLTCGAQEVTVTLQQTDNMSEVEWDAEFYKKMTAFRFTATWCGYCPAMGEAFEKVSEEMPDRIQMLSCHPKSSEGGMAWEGTESWLLKFNVGAYPTGIINEYIKIKSDDIVTTVKRIRNAATEVLEHYPAKTGIAATSTLKGNELELYIQVAMKEKKEYKVSAFVLEDGIIYPQSNGSENYNHTKVIRQAVTELHGNDIECKGDRTTADIHLTAGLSSSIKDISNAYLVIFTSYSGKPDVAEQDMVEYMDTNIIVDNVVSIPLNGSIDYRYENK